MMNGGLKSLRCIAKAGTTALVARPLSHPASSCRSTSSLTISPSLIDSVWKERQHVDHRSLPRCLDKQQMLFSTQLHFDPSGDQKVGKSISLRAVYLDTMPAGSRVGTVIATHGSPGSHKDWKYLLPRLQQAGIRLIGVNCPGFGLSEDHHQLTQKNTERNAFVEALMASLGLRENIVFMGHSRGSEDAFELSARNQHKSVGTVLVNSPGLSRPRGMCNLFSLSVVGFTSNVYKRYPAMRGVIHYLLKNYYDNVVGLRASSGRTALNAMKSMVNIDFTGKRSHLRTINEKEHMRVLNVYGCSDPFFEEELSREFSNELSNATHLVCKTTEATEEADASASMQKAFLEDGKKAVACEFVPDAHHLQRSRPAFIADGIVAMFQAANSDKKA